MFPNAQLVCIQPNDKLANVGHVAETRPASAYLPVIATISGRRYYTSCRRVGGRGRKRGRRFLLLLLLLQVPKVRLAAIRCGGFATGADLDNKLQQLAR